MLAFQEFCFQKLRHLDPEALMPAPRSHGLPSPTVCAIIVVSMVAMIALPAAITLQTARVRAAPIPRPTKAYTAGHTVSLVTVHRPSVWVNRGWLLLGTDGSLGASPVESKSDRFTGMAALRDVIVAEALRNNYLGGKDINGGQLQSVVMLVHGNSQINAPEQVSD